MSALRPVEGTDLAFSRMMATGGIGHGMLLLLEGDRTLGRDESRTAALQKARDYCKLHIISHYAAVLLRDPARPRFEVIPIGGVGDDPDGTRLMDEMARAGMLMDEVRVIPGADTLFSVCFQYPDRSGGNITTARSASGQITADDVEAACARHPRGAGRELFLAVPEAPLAARLRLLGIGRERGAFTAASVLAIEAEAFVGMGGLELTDLLAVNSDEARAFAASGGRVGSAGSAAAPIPSADAAEACAAAVEARSPGIMLAVTDGANGCYGFQGGRLRHRPGIPMNAVSTAGAGDAFMAGTLAGLACGLPFMAEPGAPGLSCALDLGTAVAAMSVASPHTIHDGITAATLREFIQEKGLAEGPAFRALFRS
jgi:sugar/nucleoside kinase (ribokinase family)